MTSIPHTPNRRADLIQGLRDLADLLEAHPQVPVPDNAEISHYPRGTDDEQRDQINRIARILNVTPAGRPDFYYATLRFGPVSYRAVALSTQSRAEWRALTSYRHNVQPDAALVEKAGAGR